MVTPYLSRLRPAESGPRLHPRPRSRFEPAPTLPIDGLAASTLGLTIPAPPGAAAADPETGAGLPGSDPAEPSAAPAGADGQLRTPAGTAAPAPGARDVESRIPAPGGRVTLPPQNSPPGTVLPGEVPPVRPAVGSAGAGPGSWG